MEPLPGPVWGIYTVSLLIEKTEKCVLLQDSTFRLSFTFVTQYYLET